MKLKRSTSINIIITIAYLLLIGLLVFQINGITDKYNKEELDLITDIEREIRIALEQPSDQLMIEGLAKAVDNYSFDIVITRDEDIVYNTIPYEIGENLLNRMHTKSVARQSQGHYDKDGDDLFIWYSIYRLSNSNFVNKFLTSILFLVLILSALIIMTVYLIMKNLLKPLRNIQKSLIEANQHQVLSEDDSDDVINKDFQNFVSKFGSDMSSANIQHTELEMQLQAKRKNLKNILAVSNVMVKHIEDLIEESKAINLKYLSGRKEDEKLIEISRLNIKSNQEILKDLNRVIDMLEKDDGFELDVEDVDIVEIIMGIISTFHKQMYAKKLTLDFDGPAQAVIESEETTLILLINNILMNMVLYATEDTEIKIELDHDDQKTILTFTNESSETNIEHMKNTEHLFNAIKDKENDEYVYSSGNGLYITKELTSILGGDYNVVTTDTLVIITISLNNKITKIENT